MEQEQSERLVAIYARVSSDPHGSKFGVERQIEDCQQLASSHGWEVARVFEDNDKSAYATTVRPEYERLIESIDSGVIDTVIAWHPDRLHRSPRELEDFISLVERKSTRLLFVRAGEYDLTTAAGRMTARVVGAVARNESEQKSERLLLKHLQLAQQGRLAGGGTRPFGFEEDRKSKRADEADLIVEAVERVLAGESVSGVAKDWHRRGVVTVTGTTWSPTVLKGMLTSARIAGWREHKGKFVAEAEWDAIVARTQVERLRSILRDPARRTNRRSRSYLLTGGIAKCGLCGANLVARPKAGGRRCYVCASDPTVGGCGKIRILAEDFETAVTELVLGALSDADFTAVLKDKARSKGHDEAQVLATIENDEAKLAELTQMLADGELTRVEFLAARERVDRRLSHNRASIASDGSGEALQALSGGLEALRASWPHKSVDARRAVISAVLLSIPVLPAVKGQNFFNPSRLGEPTWRV